MFQIPRCGDLELPLTVGRDFCGTVISKGHGVGENIQVGDEVYGFVPIHKQGSFAEAVLCDACHVGRGQLCFLMFFNVPLIFRYFRDQDI